MAVSSFSAGVISSGFSASTGLKIHNPIPPPRPRRCSVCGAETCIGHEIRAGIRWLISGIFSDWWYWGARPQNRARDDTEEEAATAAQSQAASQAIPLDMKDLFSLTCMTMTSPPSAAASFGEADEQTVRIHVHLLKRNARVTADVNTNSTVEDLRREAATKFGLPRQQLMLIFNGSQLDDHEEIKYLGIAPDTIIHGLKCTPGQQLGIFELDPSTLDPKYDFDFTNQSDDGKTYWRGGHVYERPYGWKRYAVKVHGEYEDDIWLGGGGIRTESTPGEWAVSYHGTDRRSVRPILEEGYKIGTGQHFGPAIYTSPSLKNVERYYARTFKYEGKRYKLVLQNRVDTEHLEVIPPGRTGVPGFPYWLSPMQDPDKGVLHVRPYGVLTCEV